MAIAAVAHVYVFPAEPYQFLPVSEYGKVTSVEAKTEVKVNEEDAEGKPAVVKQTEMRVEAPGTSITESVQDVVLGGGEHVSPPSIHPSLVLLSITTRWGGGGGWVH